MFCTTVRFYKTISGRTCYRTPPLQQHHIPPSVTEFADAVPDADFAKIA